jgi:hypothetical protein
MRLRELSFSEPLYLGLFLDQRKRIPFNFSRIHTKFLVQDWFEEKGFEFELGEFNVLPRLQKEYT